MYIKEIELNNFRIYKGKNKISLLPTDDKNIIVISGQNGFGKTSFLMSLVWCLYGQQMEVVDNLYKEEIKRKSNYRKYIEDSMNHTAKQNGETEFSVTIEFADVEIQNVKCNVTVKRSYNIYGNFNEKLDVKIGSSQEELSSTNNQKGKEIFIRDYILPIDIAKFFFFDAEKIDSLAEMNQKRIELSRAYSDVLGISKYEDLKVTLEEARSDYLKKRAKSEDKIKLNQLNTDIKNTEIEIDGCEKTIDELETEKETKSKKSEEIQIKLIRKGDRMSLEELKELKNKQENLEIKKAKIQEHLKELYDFIPLALAGKTLVDISEQLKNEGNLSEQKYKREEVQEKTDKIRQEIESERENKNICFDIKVRDFYEEQIIKLVKKYFYSDLPEINENMKVLHDFSSLETNEFNQLILSIKHDFKENLKKLNSEYRSTKHQHDCISRKIREAERNTQDDDITCLREKKEELDEQISACDRKIGENNLKIEKQKEQIKNYKQEYTSLLKKIEDATQYSEKEQKTKQLITTLEKFIEKFRIQKKESLQEQMLKSINTLLYKKDFIKRIDVNITSNDIDIILYDVNEQIIDKSSLSKGERQMYASALLISLVYESGIEFPVFIDSPMQKFDKTHAENIIRYFYPKVSKQVVIFPLLYKELTTEEYDLLKQHVCKTYLIKNVTNYSSEFLNLKSDNLFATYNTMYNAN